MGDAISHAVLPGIVIAHIIGLPMLLGAFIAGLMSALGANFLKQNSRLKGDTALGVVFTGMFAFGLVLFSQISTDIHLDHILMGNILGITRSQMIQTVSLAIVVISVILCLRKDLLLVCFDPSHARVIALPHSFLFYLLLSLVSITIVISLHTVGAILVIAMLVTPGCIGSLWSHRFSTMLILSALSSVSATWLGILISFYFDVSTGACIVLTLATFFALSFVFANEAKNRLKLPLYSAKRDTNL